MASASVGSGRGTSMEEICKDRVERTVKLSLNPEGRPYSRAEVLDGLLRAGVSRDGIEAIGVRERNVEWEVTFKSKPAYEQLVQLNNVDVKGESATVSSIRKGARRLRILYLPFYVPIGVITGPLVRGGATIVKAYQDKDRETGLLSNVWNVVVEVDIPELVPDRMRWSHDGMSGSVLINMSGRAPKCLRCAERGHRKFECEAPYCSKCRRVGHVETSDCGRTYASRVSGTVAETRDEIDDYGEDATETATREEPAAHQSWGDLMEQEDEAERTQQTEPSSQPATSADTAAEPVQESAMAPPAETETSSTVQTQSNDDGWTVQEGRKRRVSASPSRTGGKVMATAAADEATMTASSPVLPADPTSRRQRTRPLQVASGRPKHQRDVS